ncbi:Centromere protein J [Trichinella pseudospiralis]|uniref:Centromere protein J n=1 Tax=Trichinella pseudospiralis TaxID=6337 RepID=A0A0V1FZJ8_TRIPS|nr:Centromere protein J [Trichinella pseudospiralis]
MSSRPKFPYLKKGEGHLKYSKIDYNKANLKKAPFSEEKPREMSKSPEICADRSSPKNLPNHGSNGQNQDEALSLNCNMQQNQSLSADSSRFNYSQRSEIENIEMRHFELFEKFAHELSLNDTESYQRLLNAVCNFSSPEIGDAAQTTNVVARLHSDSPVVISVDGKPVSNDEHTHSTSPDLVIPTSKAETVPPLTATVDNIVPRVDANNGCTTSNDQSVATSVFEMLNRPGGKSSAVASAGPALRHDAPTVREEAFKGLQDTSTLSTSSSASQSSEMQKRLEKMITQLEGDAKGIERVQAKLAKDTNALEAAKRDLQKQMKDFEREKQEHFKSIESERQYLRQQLATCAKKGDDVTNILRLQITDLQNEICDKEARASGLRGRIRSLESELTATRDELQTLKERCHTLEELNSRLDRENTQMRLKMSKFQGGIAKVPSSSTVAGSFPCSVKMVPKSGPLEKNSSLKKSTNKEKEKTVRFLIPEHEPQFSRTEDRAIQTDLLPTASTSKAEQQQLPFATVVRHVHSDSNCPLNSREQVSQFIEQGFLGKSPPQATFERIRQDGSVEVIYGNGTIQEVSADGERVTYHYCNGDSRRFLADGSEVYHFGSKGIVQIREPSGIIKLKYKDGRVEVHYPDNRIDIEIPNEARATIYPDGRQTKIFQDGTTVEKAADGTEVVHFVDGSKEVRHKDYLRREFPCGDVKFKYSDGTEETRYASGRVRVKDKHGKVIRDEIVPKQ